jgi:hypothetical protein
MVEDGYVHPYGYESLARDTVNGVPAPSNVYGITVTVVNAVPMTGVPLNTPVVVLNVTPVGRG